MINKITHFTLFVDNQDVALRFYTEKLGFKVHTDAMITDSTMSEMRWLTLNLPGQKDVELAIMLAGSPLEKSLVGKQGGDKPLFCLETSDCKKDYETLIKSGVEGVQAPKEEPWGVSALFKDQNGNLIYISQPTST